MSLWNPYLQQLVQLGDARFDEYHRNRLKRRFGYICPSSAAIRLLLKEQFGIIEFMAGSGYFMEVIRRAADRKLRRKLWASDLHPPNRFWLPTTGIAWDKKWFRKLRRGNEFHFPKLMSATPKPTMLLVWPFLNNTADAHAVHRFAQLGGTRLALVQSFDYASGSFALQKLIKNCWRELASAPTFNCSRVLPCPRLRVYELVQ